MSNSLLQKIVLLRVMEVGKIILKKKQPLLLARGVYSALQKLTKLYINIHSDLFLT